MRNIKLVGSILLLSAASLVAAAAQGAVVIQEVLYDGPGTDADDVFTELFGAPGTSLDDWSLAGINGLNGEVYRMIDLTGLSVPADGLLVLATGSAHSELAAQRDAIANVDWQNGPDALQLLRGSEVMDALQYGDAGPFNAGEGEVAPDIAGIQSLSRDLFASDTDSNVSDFTATTATPGIGPAVVPLPPAIWLLGSALGGLGALRRNRKTNA